MWLAAGKQFLSRGGGAGIRGHCGRSLRERKGVSREWHELQDWSGPFYVRVADVHIGYQFLHKLGAKGDYTSNSCTRSS
jgi:hypothetical protein